MRLIKKKNIKKYYFNKHQFQKNLNFFFEEHMGCKIKKENYS